MQIIVDNQSAIIGVDRRASFDTGPAENPAGHVVIKVSKDGVSMTLVLAPKEAQDIGVSLIRSTEVAMQRATAPAAPRILDRAGGRLLGHVPVNTSREEERRRKQAACAAAPAEETEGEPVESTAPNAETNGETNGVPS